MIKVPNIPFSQYLSSPDRLQYDYYLRYADIEPRDFFNIGPVQDLTFGVVKDFQYYLNNAGLTWLKFIELIAPLINQTEKEIAQTPIFFLQQSRLFVRNEIEDINKLEAENLSHKPSAKESAAGLERFEVYGSFPQYDQLAKGYIARFKEIDEIPYLVAFTKLKYEVDKRKFQDDINNIK